MPATGPTSPSLSRRRLLAASATASVAAAAGLVPPPARAANDWQAAVLPQAQQRDFTSKITGQRYRIFISIPQTPAPPSGHPVLFALDGNATFPTLALMARLGGGRSHGSGQAAPVIVGIGYAADQHYSIDRGHDYTPPGGKDAPENEGGADPFLDFIERELKPLVAAMAPLDPARQALFGHSYGGLCALYALFTRPALFQTYLAASPSIWYGGRRVLADVPDFMKRAGALAAKPALMVTVGELEQPAATAAALQGREAIAAQRRMVDEARDLAARLREANVLSRVQFHLLAHENHGSAMLPAMVRGLEFFYAQHQ